MNSYLQGFLWFEVVKPIPPRKTLVVQVSNADDHCALGEIRWYGQWRQYCFFPNGHCVFHRGCLEHITICLNSLMVERRAESRASQQITPVLPQEPTR